MNTEFKIQTCNGNPEVIKVINGIARTIIAEFKTMKQAEQYRDVLASTYRSGPGWQYIPYPQPQPFKI